MLRTRTQLWLGAAVIIALTLLVYSPAMRAGFIWDDDTFLTGNKLIKASDGLYRFWFTADAPDYFPLTSTTLWIEWRLWGENARGYHITNIVLHTIATLLLWRVLVLMRLPVPHAGAAAWACAMLFAVHPVNVESVAWITQRKNTLPMVFYLLTLLTWLKFDTTRAARWYAISLVMFLLALLSKTAVAPLPVVLLLLAWWKHGRISRRDLLLSMPFFLLAGVLSVMTVYFQYNNAIAGSPVRTDGLLSRSLGAATAVWFYLHKTLWPLEPTFYYPRWQIDPARAIWWLPVIALAATALALWLFRQRIGRHALFALAYFVVMLLPVLGFFDIYFMRYALVADHWQYFAMIGVIVFVVASLDRALANLPRVAPQFLVALAILACSAISWRYAHAFESEPAMWDDVLRKNPGCWLVYNNRGAHLSQRGDAHAALADFEKSIALNPDYADPYGNIGLLLWQRGQVDQAIIYYQRSLALNPKDPSVNINLALALAAKGDYDQAYARMHEIHNLEPDNPITYFHLGLLYQQQQRLDEAVKHMSRAVELMPAYALARNQLGLALMDLKRFDDALVQFDALLAMNDQDARTHSNAASAHMAMGRLEQARDHLREVVRLLPMDGQTRLIYARVLEQLGANDQTIEQLDFIAWLDPNHAGTRMMLGIALARSRQFELAHEHLAQAVALAPTQIEPRMNLALALQELGRNDQALREYETVLELQPGFGPAHSRVADLLSMREDTDRAAGHYEQALASQPDHVHAMNNLAWILATHEPLRDSKRAVQLALRATELSDHDPLVLDTLAVAYAIDGQREAALDAWRRAEQRAVQIGRSDLLDQLHQQRIKYLGE